ncbi:MAG: hypothetical protein FJW83_11770, partial [Actinobacteria bacterium]|nr:hypothetical protein [Actinomycetota bacterium]
MSPSGDHDDGMDLFGRIDDVLEDPLLRRFVDEVRLAADGTAPVPSPALRALLEGGAQALGAEADEGDELAARRRRRLRIPAAVAALSVVGKIALGGGIAAAATAATTGAAIAGVLPGPIESVVATVVETVTPFSIDTGRRADPVPTVTVTLPDGSVIVVPQSSAPDRDRGTAPGNSGTKPSNPGG